MKQGNFLELCDGLITVINAATRETW
jgi:hypothetical protein